MVLTDDSQERLPEGYSMGMESPNLLVLLRPDGTVVKRFFFSSMGPTPQALVEAAEEDLLLLEHGTDIGGAPFRGSDPATQE